MLRTAFVSLERVFFWIQWFLLGCACILLFFFFPHPNSWLIEIEDFQAHNDEINEKSCHVEGVNIFSSLVTYTICISLIISLGNYSNAPGTIKRVVSKGIPAIELKWFGLFFSLYQQFYEEFSGDVVFLFFRSRWKKKKKRDEGGLGSDPGDGINLKRDQTRNEKGNINGVNFSMTETGAARDRPSSENQGKRRG